MKILVLVYRVNVRYRYRYVSCGIAFEPMLLPTWFFTPAFRIHAVFIPIRTTDKGSGSCSFLQWLSRCFFIITYCRFIYVSLQRQQTLNSHKNEEIKVFLNFFWFLREGSGIGSVQIIPRSDPDLRGPKSYKSVTCFFTYLFGQKAHM